MGMGGSTDIKVSWCCLVHRFRMISGVTPFNQDSEVQTSFFFFFNETRILAASQASTGWTYRRIPPHSKALSKRCALCPL